MGYKDSNKGGMGKGNLGNNDTIGDASTEATSRLEEGSEKTVNDVVESSATLLNRDSQGGNMIKNVLDTTIASSSILCIASLAIGLLHGREYCDIRLAELTFVNSILQALSLILFLLIKYQCPDAATTLYQMLKYEFTRRTMSKSGYFSYNMIILVMIHPLICLGFCLNGLFEMPGSSCAVSAPGLYYESLALFLTGLIYYSGLYFYCLYATGNTFNDIYVKPMYKLSSYFVRGGNKTARPGSE